MFESIAVLVTRRGWLVVLGWMVFTGLLVWKAPSWHSVTRDDDVRFFPPEYPSVVGQGLLERGFPEDIASSTAVVIAERRSGRLTQQDLAFIDRVTRRLGEIARAEPGLGIKKLTDRHAVGIGAKLVSPVSGEGQAALTLISLEGTYVSKQARVAVERILEELQVLRPQAPEGLALEITGSAAVGHDTNRASTSSIGTTTYATIGLVVVILLVVYRSPLLALIPLLTIALSVWTSLLGIALLTTVPGLNFQVINITNVFVVVVLFGAGTDYCLFLIARYREELARGRRGDDALAEAIKQVGGALIASAGTVIIGLGMLYFSTFAKISYTGPAIGLSLVIALVAALTLSPVLLHWLRGAVFWPFRPPHHTEGRDPEQESLAELPMAGFWGGVANTVVRRPGIILVLSVAALTPLAWTGLQTQSSYDLLSDLDPDQPSVVGARAIARHFPDGELGPSTLLVVHPTLNFRSDEGVDVIEKVSRELAKLPNVAEVRSVSRPLGKTLPSVARRLDQPSPAPAPSSAPSSNPLGALFNRLSRADLPDKAILLAGGFDRYVSTKARSPEDRDHITRIDLVFQTSPFSAESLQTLDLARRVVDDARMDQQPLDGARRIGLAGTSALVSDLRNVTRQDQQRMYVLVTLGVFLILLALIRRPGICLYLIATVIFGYLASLGATELVFKALHTGPEPWVGMDWKVGFFLFVILVAVGEDYNIFLMARVIEEESKHGAIEGTRRAVAHTGGIISSCGLIMAGTFAAMLWGELSALRQLGFALSVGVLLDTFVVRPILVPAFVVLWHRAWPGAPLDPPKAPLGHVENGRAASSRERTGQRARV